MTTENNTATALENQLSELDEPPDADITREVGWEDRLEGSIYAGSMGHTVQRVYRLKEVYDLMSSTESFKVRYGDLATWVEESLGDAKLANAIRQAKDTEEPRQQVIEILEFRLSQVGEL